MLWEQKIDSTTPDSTIPEVGLTTREAYDKEAEEEAEAEEESMK